MSDQRLTANASPSVVFVAVNWNQQKLTLECLESLHQQQYENFSVVVVDNGSTDGSIAAIGRQWPGVTVLENGRNLGIAAANNAGIRYALDKGSDYIFLLNNDTIVDKRMLQHLVTAAESDRTVGMTGPTMLYYDDPEVIWSAGNSIDWKNGDTTRLKANEIYRLPKEATPVEVDFITSCAVCIKSVVFKDVGLMDERYFIYYDETDWFARATAAGWRSVYIPKAKMWHKVSATMGTTSPATDYYMSRNALLFLGKQLSGLKRMRSISHAVVKDMLTVAAYTLKSHNGQRIRNRDARALALRDALLGRWGEMGGDVARRCYPGR